MISRYRNYRDRPNQLPPAWNTALMFGVFPRLGRLAECPWSLAFDYISPVYFYGPAHSHRLLPQRHGAESSNAESSSALIWNREGNWNQGCMDTSLTRKSGVHQITRNSGVGTQRPLEERFIVKEAKWIVLEFLTIVLQKNYTSSFSHDKYLCIWNMGIHS